MKIAETTAEGEQIWNDVCNAQGWDNYSQILHLEEFIRKKGLFAEFSTFAQDAAAEEEL